MSHSAPGPRDPAIEALTAGQLVTVHFADGRVLRGRLEPAAGAALTLGGDDQLYVRYADGTTAPGVHGVVHLIDTPGLYDGIPDAIYHAGQNTPEPSLSQSLLKLLIPPSTPAHFNHRRSHPEPPKRVFDVGRAAHTRALGVGEDMAPCPTEYLSVDGKMTTVKAKAWAAEQRSNGVVPLTPGDYDTVFQMAEALVHHDRVADLLTEPAKRPEVTAYAPHPDAGVWLRGRFDLMGGGLWDYKTSASADPEVFRKSAWAYGYHVQDATYRLLHELVVGFDPGPMVFLVQEKVPPFLCSTVVLDGQFETAARRQLDAALALYQACTIADHWPGYPDEIVTISPPPYARGLDAAAAADDGTTDTTEIFAFLDSINH